MTLIPYDDFDKVEIRVGKIIKVEILEARKPTYKLWMDFGELGIKKSSAHITKLYTPEELIERQILAVTNFPPRQIADFLSEVLVLDVVIDNDEVSLIQSDRLVPLGKRIS